MQEAEGARGWFQAVAVGEVLGALRWGIDLAILVCDSIETGKANFEANSKQIKNFVHERLTVLLEGV